MADALASGLKRRPAIAELRRVPADDFVEMVIDRAEEPAPAVLFGVEAGRIGAPHHIRPVGDDRPVVGRVAIGRPQPAGGQQPVGPHQPEHALTTDRAATMSEPCAHLPIAFAMKGTRGQHRADLLNETPGASSARRFSRGPGSAPAPPARPSCAARACPAPGRSVASAPTRAPALGSPATRHPRPHRAVTATPTPSSAVRSSAPAGRPRSLLASVRCRRVCPSGAWPSSQPPWLPLIPPLAGEMSKEIGSDLTGCVILRNSHVIRVAARRVRLIREILVKSWLTTAHARSEEDMMAARLPYLDREQVPPDVQAVYDKMKKATGRVLNT